MFTGREIQREREWIDAIQRGEERAFDELFHFYFPDLCAYAVTLTGTADLAREVVQEVFLKLWESRERWNVRVGIAPYLYRSVRNQALTCIRQRRRHINLDLDGHDRAADGNVEDTLQFETLMAAYRDAVTALPERRRTAFVLHREHAMSAAEIAVVMQISERTVETHIGHALAALREKLADFLDDG